YHRLGTPQSADVLIYDRPDQKDWFFDGYVTEDGNYLMITISQGTDVKSRIYYKDLTSKDSPVVKLLDNYDASYTLIANDGPVFGFRTDLQTARGKIIAIDVTKPARTNWRVVVPEAAETLQGVTFVN